jgi:hypothetical protein
MKASFREFEEMANKRSYIPGGSESDRVRAVLAQQGLTWNKKTKWWTQQAGGGM